MNNKVINTLEGKGRTTRGHLKGELMKLGLGFMRTVPAKFLLMPTMEVEWMKKWERLTVMERGNLLEKRNLLALTILHPPIHNIVRQEGFDSLKKQGLTKGMGAVARRIIYEWKKQGKPRPGPMQIGETLMIMENRMGPLIVRTIIEEKKKRYLITKVARTQEIRWGELTIPATKPRAKQGGNKLQENLFFRTR